MSANEFHWRYLAPSLLLVHLAGLSFLAEPLCRRPRAGGPALALALLLVPLAAVVAFGPPSPARVRADLDARLGTWTEDVLAARCDLVAGDYWSVWPAVWHAGWQAHRRGVPGAVRHHPPHQRHRPLLEGPPPRGSSASAAIRGEEAQSEYWLRAFHLWPVRTIEERKTVEVVAPGG